MARAGDCWHYLGRYDLVSDSFSKAGSLQSALEARMTQDTYCQRGCYAAVVEIGANRQPCDPSRVLLWKLVLETVFDDSGCGGNSRSVKRESQLASS